LKRQTGEQGERAKDTNEPGWERGGQQTSWTKLKIHRGRRASTKIKEGEGGDANKKKNRNNEIVKHLRNTNIHCQEEEKKREPTHGNRTEITGTLIKEDTVII